VLAENEELEEEFKDAIENLDETEEIDEIQPQISLNALNGVSSYQTLRVLVCLVTNMSYTF
jgi:hypothetical protein